MNVNIRKQNNKIYIEMIPGKMMINDEQDAVDLVGLCGENKTNKILFYDENLSENFFNLKTKTAGGILQKFTNYNVKAALVLSNDNYIKGRFGEMVLEANKGGNFGVFIDKKKAEEWLLT